MINKPWLSKGLEDVKEVAAYKTFLESLMVLGSGRLGFNVVL